MVLHRREADTVDCLFIVCRPETQGLIKRQAVGGRIQRDDSIRDITEQLPEQPCADPSSVAAAFYKEKADMSLFGADTDLTDQCLSSFK